MDDYRVSLSGMGEGVSQGVSVLRIRWARLEDAGLYVCVVTTEGHPPVHTMPAKFDVIGEPVYLLFFSIVCFLSFSDLVREIKSFLFLNYLPILFFLRKRTAQVFTETPGFARRSGGQREHPVRGEGGGAPRRELVSAQWY